MDVFDTNTLLAYFFLIIIIIIIIIKHVIIYNLSIMSLYPETP